jgi:hypothetical protein
MEQARTHSDIYMAWFELRKGGGQIEEKKVLKMLQNGSKLPCGQVFSSFKALKGLITRAISCAISCAICCKSQMRFGVSAIWCPTRNCYRLHVA